VMEAAHQGKPVEDFPNVESLSKLALTRQVRVDTPDSAPTDDEAPPQTPPASKPPEASPPPAPPPPKPPDLSP